MIDEALSRLVTDDLLAALWNATGDEEGGEVLALVTALGPAVINRLIEEMATEENAGRRKVLVELLGELGEQNVRPLVKRLDDPRWFVVRNLATVLGKSGNPRAVKPLRDLAVHDDYRVRLEALRALVPLDQDAATDVLVRALSDSNQRITQLALTYLRNGKRPVEPLVEAVETGDLAGDVLVEVIDIIARQGGEAAASALEEIAGRKFAVRGSDRAARQAAKDALKRLAR